MCKVEDAMVTDIRQSSTRDTFIEESVYLVRNSLLGWKSVEKLKELNVL